MGVCSSSDISTELFKKYSRADVKAHFLAMAKLNHFNQRVNVLVHEADQDVKQIKQFSFNQIQLKRKQIIAGFEQQIRLINENKEEFDKANKEKVSVEQYVGLDAVRKQIDAYEQSSRECFEQIEQKMQQNNNEIFNRIEEEIKADLIEIQDTPTLKKEQVEAFFEKMKHSYRNEVKAAEVQVEKKFQQELSPDYFRKKLQSVVTQADLQKLEKTGPRKFNNTPLVEQPKMPQQSRKWCFLW